MDIYEDSMPLRFTPDGLDEATIDALIEQAYAQVSDKPAHLSADRAKQRRARRGSDLPMPNHEAA